MRTIVTAIVFFKQRTVCIINVWGCAEILPRRVLKACYFKENGNRKSSHQLPKYDYPRCDILESFLVVAHARILSR